jgi:dienelactone hydrolase
LGAEIQSGGEPPHSKNLRNFRGSTGSCGHRYFVGMNRATLLALFCAVSACFGENLKAFKPGTVPNDVRLEPLKDLDGYFPFEVPPTKEIWEKRAKFVREQLQVALGLWPMPDKTPLNAVIHGKMDMGDYTVEKVYFESMPGFFVSGSLYRPKGKTGRVPGVLNPHGHWENGRFYDNKNGILREIADGAERFEDSGRSPLQSRCVQLARMGCVAFFYDMIGYADSQQISQAIAHGFAKQRPEMNSPENWGLFSPQAEEHLQSVMGLQTWDSIRALDFLLSLPDVDPNRIGVTGASGGGTQTFILCAIDPRPTVAFPAVMVSTAMQGGCTCENASLLRVDTGNVEIAALFAPKPLGMTAADDWTKEMPTKGFPELQKLYAMMGAPDKVSLKPALHFGHNYNQVSRVAMYNWMNKQLGLGLKEPVIEKDFRRLTAEELTVWDAQHPKPLGGPEFEKQLLRNWNEDAQKKIQAASASVDQFRALMQPALDVMIQRRLVSAGQCEFETGDKVDRGSYLEIVGVIKNKSYKEELPILNLYPKEWKGRTVIWLSEAGKDGVRDGDGLKADVKKLVDAGTAVIGVDLLYQGEFTIGQPVTHTRRVKNPREAAAYTFGYNETLFAQRVNDVLSVIAMIKNHERQSASIDLVALDKTGPIAAVARAQSGNAIRRLVIGNADFRFGNVTEIHDVSFLPGGAKYGDLPGFLAFGAPGETRLVGESAVPELTKKIYGLAGKSEAAATLAKSDGAISAWILQ